MQCIGPGVVYAAITPGGPVAAVSVWIPTADAVCTGSELAVMTQTEFDVAFGSALNPDMVAAQVALFGAVLLAGVLIWGAKSLYSVFVLHREEG